MKYLILLLDKIKSKYNCLRLYKYIKCGKKTMCFSSVNIINKNVTVGENVIIYPNVSFEGNGSITIGNNVKIGTNVVLSAQKDGGIVIGNNTIIAANSYIVDSNHGMERNCLISSQPLKTKKITIGDDVWIGTNSSIIFGSKIGNGAVVGANSLVNTEVEPYSIVVGTPARVIKYRK